MRAVLTYHSIDDSGSSISVRPDAFERHVRWLASGRVQVMALDDLARSHSDAPAVALTFDDGFENFATHAAPLLRVHGFPATVFVVTDRVGEDKRLEWDGGGGANPSTSGLACVGAIGGRGNRDWGPDANPPGPDADLSGGHGRRDCRLG